MDNDESNYISLAAIPSRVTIAGWRLDPIAIHEAVKELGIELPFLIRFRTYPRGKTTYGDHRCRPPGIHYIMLNEELTEQAVNHTLWHELVHAWQAEYFAKVTQNPPWQFHEIYIASSGDLGAEYINNRLEIEARNLADANQYKLLVVT